MAFPFIPNVQNFRVKTLKGTQVNQVVLRGLTMRVEVIFVVSNYNAQCLSSCVVVYLLHKVGVND